MAEWLNWLGLVLIAVVWVWFAAASLSMCDWRNRDAEKQHERSEAARVADRTSAQATEEDVGEDGSVHR